MNTSLPVHCRNCTSHVVYITRWLCAECNFDPEAILKFKPILFSQDDHRPKLKRPRLCPNCLEESNINGSLCANCRGRKRSKVSKNVNNPAVKETEAMPGSVGKFMVLRERADQSNLFHPLDAEDNGRVNSPSVAAEDTLKMKVLEDT